MRTASVLGLAMAGLFGIASDPAMAGAAASSAYSLDAQFTVGGVNTGLGPVNSVSGSAPPAYSKTATAPNFTKSVILAPGSPPVPIFTATATGLRSHVASSGIGVDAVSASGEADVASSVLMLVESPLSSKGAQTVPVSDLAVSANGVRSTASFNEVFPNRVTVIGTSNFTSLAVTGRLLGGKTVMFSGSAPKNKVLFQSDTIKITVNQQIPAGVISCNLTCTFTPTAITTNALDIHLNKANLNGRLVSGDIILAQSHAE